MTIFFLYLKTGINNMFSNLITLALDTVFFWLTENIDSRYIAYLYVAHERLDIIRFVIQALITLIK